MPFRARRLVPRAAISLTTVESGRGRKHSWGMIHLPVSMGALNFIQGRSRDLVGFESLSLRTPLAT